MPGLLLAPVAGGEEDLAAGGLERHAHGLVAHLAVAVCGEIAEVVLEEVHAPLGKGGRVHELVVKARGVAGAGANPRAGVHAELEALAVDVVGHGLHAVGELFGVGNEAAVRAALAQGPAVVDDEVFIPCVAVALFDHGVRHLAHERVGDVCAERIPGIPAHGCGSCDHGCTPSLVMHCRDSVAQILPPRQRAEKKSCKSGARTV